MGGVNSIDNADGKKGGAPKLTEKGKYKKVLNKYNLEKIQKYAKQHNLKITKKVNGKTVKLSKSSLIAKLANKKYH
jgi:hypothetical protein